MDKELKFKEEDLALARVVSAAVYEVLGLCRKPPKGSITCNTIAISRVWDYYKLPPELIEAINLMSIDDYNANIKHTIGRYEEEDGFFASDTYKLGWASSSCEEEKYSRIISAETKIDEIINVIEDGK